jgi:hypothetical protein
MLPRPAPSYSISRLNETSVRRIQSKRQATCTVASANVRGATLTEPRMLFLSALSRRLADGATLATSQFP